MRDYLTLGPVPCDEDCQQIGTPEYDPAACVAECRRFVTGLEQHYAGNIPDGARFTIKSFSHDFGSYREVCVSFNDEDEDAAEFAYLCESSAPATWTELETTTYAPKPALGILAAMVAANPSLYAS